MGKKRNDIAKVIVLTERERQIILGSLLGDGALGIYKGYASARFQERHSIIQVDYITWKQKELNRLCSDKAMHVQQPDGFSKNQKIKLQTLTHPALTKLYYEVTTNGQKDISKPWLNTVESLALAVWWCDDGSKIGRDARRGKWNTQGWGEEGNKILREFLLTKFDVKTEVYSYVERNGKTYYYLALARNQLKKLLTIMLPYCPTSSMLYKFFIKYQDQNLQQHWIGVMKNELPQFAKEIDELAKQKNSLDFFENL